jgi:hypothetical protein
MSATSEFLDTNFFSAVPFVQQKPALRVSLDRFPPPLDKEKEGLTTTTNGTFFDVYHGGQLSNLLDSIKGLRPGEITRRMDELARHDETFHLAIFEMTQSPDAHSLEALKSLITRFSERFFNLVKGYLEKNALNTYASCYLIETMETWGRIPMKKRVKLLQYLSKKSESSLIRSTAASVLGDISE